MKSKKYYYLATFVHFCGVVWVACPLIFIKIDREKKGKLRSRQDAYTSKYRGLMLAMDHIIHFSKLKDGHSYAVRICLLRLTDNGFWNELKTASLFWPIFLDARKINL